MYVHDCGLSMSYLVSTHWCASSLKGKFNKHKIIYTVDVPQVLKFKVFTVKRVTQHKRNTHTLRMESP